MAGPKKLSDSEAALYHFSISRVADNRLNGLLRELAEAIQAEDDPRTLRHFAQSLGLLAGRARSRGYSLNSDKDRIW